MAGRNSPANGASCPRSPRPTRICYLEIRGDAEITPDDDYSFADRFGAKYQADLRAHDGPGDRRVVVTIRPTRVNAVDMRG
jgi:hypothetical protein